MIQNAALHVHFSPFFHESVIMILGALAIIVLSIAALKSHKAIIWRAVTICLCFIAILNPSLLEEEREKSPDIVTIVVDRSTSQSFLNRLDNSEKALNHLQNELKKHENLELRILETPPVQELNNETFLFEALSESLSDVPVKNRAGTIFISDGQIHDIPENHNKLSEYGPIHLLLTGDKDEKDRHLEILKSPSYGIIDQSVNVSFRINDTSNIGAKDATITISHPNEKPEVMVVPVNTELSIDLPIINAGQNIFEISVQNISGEITNANNRSAVIVNGVRDRLKVLLVSGKPHAGGRTWRDLLTSDPGVDLVHFTILREPSKLDATPQDELALIAFPFRELFEIKLYDFDLIIFDRYQLNRILPQNYFDNIVRYVQKGGALLEASGPSYASESSVYNTSLMNVLPAAPTGTILETAFKPNVTKDGKNHPVTKNLVWKNSEQGKTQWGEWLRQIEVRKDSGDTLMKGVNDMPLLILDRVEEGRVAQITSDHVWLWSRGYDGGGPHTELLRRVVHWLMKEPELDERTLKVSVNDSNIKLVAPGYQKSEVEFLMTKPNGEKETIKLEQNIDGNYSTIISVDQLGIYDFENDENQKIYAIVGNKNPLELSAVITTEEKMKSAIQSTGGGIIWLSENSKPNIRLTPNRKKYSGKDWIGLRRNYEYIIKGNKITSLFPPWFAMLSILSLMVLTWWREGKST